MWLNEANDQYTNWISNICLRFLVKYQQIAKKTSGRKQTEKKCDFPFLIQIICFLVKLWNWIFDFISANFLFEILNEGESEEKNNSTNNKS